MRLPDGASRYASVPPPAPEPMMMTSKCVVGDMGTPRQKLVVTTTEDAGHSAGMVELGAEDAAQPARAHVRLGGEQHADDRRKEVDPERLRLMGRKRRPQRTRGIQAHARNRRLEGDVERDEGTCRH